MRDVCTCAHGSGRARRGHSSRCAAPRRSSGPKCCSIARGTCGYTRPAVTRNGCSYSRYARPQPAGSTRGGTASAAAGLRGAGGEPARAGAPPPRRTLLAAGATGLEPHQEPWPDGHPRCAVSAGGGRALVGAWAGARLNGLGGGLSDPACVPLGDAENPVRRLELGAAQERAFVRGQVEPLPPHRLHGVGGRRGARPLVLREHRA